MHPQSVSNSRSFHLGFLLAVLLLFSTAWAASLPARSYAIGVTVRDYSDKLIPDALVVVRIYNSSSLRAGSDPAPSRIYEALTNPSGYATLRIPVGYNQSTPRAVLSVFTPFWSSSPITLTLLDKTSVQEQTVTIPFSLNTYSIRLQDAADNPIPLALVYLDQPFPMSKITDINGLAIFRLPAESNVSGIARYAEREEAFGFEPMNQSEKPQEVTLTAPLLNESQTPLNKTYAWTVLLLDSMGKPLDRQPLKLSTNASNWTILTDRDGYIYLRNWAEPVFELSWTSFNFTHRFDINLSNASSILRMPGLIQISNPAKESLGDSCYRISVNVTDRRAHPSLRVIAQAENGEGVLPFSMDRTVKMTNGSGLQFSRVLCVESDLVFNVIADNPFEQASLQIQLKTSDAPPVKAKYTQAPPAGLLDKAKAKQEDSHRVEMVLVLFYVFVVLIMLFIALRFKESLLFYLHSISRFTYSSYQDRQVSARAPKDGKFSK